MKAVKLLDCTLRDGGYVNDWDFTASQITATIADLTDAGIDYVEMGYLTSILSNVNGSRFQSVESASKFIPSPPQKKSKYLLMADVAQFDTETLCHRSAETIDGIRVVFYKRQIEEALAFCKKIVEMGYDLFLQPMVTVDYTYNQFSELIQRFCCLYHPYAISIVDSFGCMRREELFDFFSIIDQNVESNVKIGYHGHDNLQLSLINAISLCDYQSNRQLIIDTSVNGIGRGAGNLCTELFVNYINQEHPTSYGIDSILNIISGITEPLTKVHNWGYSPYMMLTALRRAHPNFATYLLANHQMSVNDFKSFLKMIPDSMLTRCTRPYVEELYRHFIEGNMA